MDHVIVRPSTEHARRRIPPLRRGARRAVLTVHIVSAGAWIGIDVVLGVLVFTAMATDTARIEALCYQALELFAVWPLFAAGLICLASGIVLGLGSNYGLITYWWVAVKLALNLLLPALVLLALRPASARSSDVRRGPGGRSTHRRRPRPTRLPTDRVGTRARDGDDAGRLQAMGSHSSLTLRSDPGSSPSGPVNATGRSP